MATLVDEQERLVWKIATGSILIILPGELFMRKVALLLPVNA